MRNAENLPFAVLLIACVGLGAAPAHAENWPQWRGPEGNSVSRERELPIAWNENSGVVWKTAIPEWGNSTPAIWGEAIFLTTQRGNQLQLLRLSKKSGRIEWTETVGEGETPREATYGKAKFHESQNLASPSPVTDGKVVVAHFGNGLLAAYDFAGRQLWQRNLQDDYGQYSIWWGHANSPVIHEGLVISVAMQDSLAAKDELPKAKSYLGAHDLATGERRWFTPRHTGAQAEECDSYTTPVVYQGTNGPELIVMGGNQLDAYDPAKGTRRWFLGNIVGGRTITGPTVAHDMVYATQGMRGPLLAVKLGGVGERTRKDIAWRDTQGTPDTCCPVVWEDLLFTVSDDGIARCFEAHGGKLQWKERLKGGKYRASPLAAQGRVYFLNTEGLCTVISASHRFDKLTENRLDDETLASPAVSAGRLFIRGRKALYCIGP